MKLSTTARIVAGTALGIGLVALAPPTDAHASTVSAASQAGASSAATLGQMCWQGRPVSIRGARMEYYECRRDIRGTQQTSIAIRVKDTRRDGKCAVARGAIGYTWNKRSVRTRVRVVSCTAGHWSAWRRSGWWNGNQGYEYVYLRR
ncbi:hypothetical protein Acsp04_43250 [Actinomadura sp. NBRC 104425]|uniref:hypothetical protein n=1 Tax=Actinomadura sp. NBRC 104425 TaxID=3032204 RepID=UPI0024A359AB|nr:hypothetical protein [Actinomadura sp. NBRC 104425]GLZ14090.1 hypothetical protein Acsp04_43250 [Actinomadura sp. NBRC 104425]